MTTDYFLHLFIRLTEWLSELQHQYPIYIIQDIEVVKDILKSLELCFRKTSAGIAAISLAGAGAGVGVVFGSLQISVARNFIRKNDLFNYALLGFALTEAVGLLGFMISMLLLYG